MKRTYEKPIVLCEYMTPEMICSACLEKNVQYNEAQQCGYFITALNTSIFADNWTQCLFNKEEVNVEYCYQPGVITLFGS